MNFTGPSMSSGGKTVRRALEFGRTYVVWPKEDAPGDLEGLDAAAAYVANLLSTEPTDIKLGIGGFSMGAVTSHYTATCFAQRKYGNDNPYPANLSAVVGLSGGIPCSKTLNSKIGGDNEATRRAVYILILLCHGKALATTASLKRWMRFVLGSRLNWGLKDALRNASNLEQYLQEQQK